MQYRVGTSGSWTTVSGTGNPYSQAGGTTGVKANVAVILPAAANNQSVVQLRWATWRGTESGSSSGVAIDNVTVNTSFASDHFRSKATGNWNAAATWESSHDGTNWFDATVTPDNNANTITVRSPNTVTVTASVSADQLTVNSGGQITVNSGQTLTIANGTGTDLTVDGTVATAGTVSVAASGTAQINNILQINEGGWGGNTGTYAYGASGTLVFNNSSGLYGVGSTDTWWPSSSGPVNVTVQNTGGLQLNSISRTVSGTFQTARGVTLSSSTLTCTGTCQLNSGGFFNQAPTYGSSSTLIYNTTGTYGRGPEWSATSGAGYPANVQISNNTTLNLGANSGAATARACSGNLTIDAGSTLSMNVSGSVMTAALTVGGNVSINGTLTLSASSGGDLYVAGNWTRANTATFTPNERAVFFNGTGTQVVTVSVGETFNYLLIQGSSTLQLATGTNITVDRSGGLTLGSSATNSMDLNGQTLLYSGGGNLNLSSGARGVTSTLANGVFSTASFANITVTTGGSSALTFGQNVIVSLNSMSFNFNGVTTLNGTLRLNNGGAVTSPPTYGANSTLLYNSAGTYGQNNEWFDNTTSGAGYPAHVRVSNNTTLNLSANSNINCACSGDLTIDAGSTVTLVGMVGALTVGGNVNINGTLTLSTSIGGDIALGGNWVDAGTFNANSRSVTFNGTGNQSVSKTGGNIFAYLIINKASGTVNMSNNVTVNGTAGNTLQLLSGTITTGANTLTVSWNDINAISRTSGHVIGNLQRAIATGANTYLYPVGVGNNYTPASIAFTSVGTGGDVTVLCSDGVAGDYTTYGLSASKYVNRNWLVTNSGVASFSANATFTYIAGDLVGGAVFSNLKPAKFDTPTWTYPSTSPTAPTATTFTANGITSFSKFTAGECGTVAVAPSPSPAFVCVGSLLNINGTPSGGTGTYSHAWTCTGCSGLVALNNVSTQTVQVDATSGMAGSATLTYQATDGAGCTASTNVALTVRALPTLSGVSLGTTPCSGGNAQIFLSGLLPNVSQNVTYTIGGGAPVTELVNSNNIGGGQLNPTVTFANNGQTFEITQISVFCTQTFTMNNSVALVVNPNLTPTVSIVASPSGAICAGASVLFTATAGSTGGGSINYDFKINGGSVQSGASNTYSTTTLANGNTVTCDITVTGGTCLSSTMASSNTITMTVNPVLLASVASISPAAQCANGTVTVGLSGTAASLPTGAYTVTYSLSAPNTASGLTATMTVTVAGTGNFTVSGLANEGSTTITVTNLASNGCSYAITSSNTIDVFVIANPTLGGASQAAPVCAGTGATINLTGLLPNSTSIIQYTINGVVQTAIPGVVANGAGAASFTSAALTGANNGQTLQITQVTNTDPVNSPPSCPGAFAVNVTLSVNPTLTPTVSIAASPSGAICAGASVLFTATAGSTGGGSINYDFKINGSSVQSSVSNTYTTTTLANGNTVTCDITVTGGTCLTSPTATSNTITMTVNALPTLSGVSLGTTPCSGGNAQIFLSGLLPNVSQNVTYTIGGGAPVTESVNSNIGGGGQLNPVVTFANNGQTFEITQISVFCTQTFTMNNSLALVVHPVPTATAPANQFYCNGQMTAAISLSGTPGGVTFDISGGAAIGLANQNGVTSVPSFTAVTGSATITITPKANGCTGSPVMYNITVNDNPTAVISGNLSFCTGGSTTLTASGGSTYLWDGGSTNPVRVISTAGTYTVQVTDGNSCTDTETATVTEQCPDYTISTTGNAIFITDLSGNGETLDVTESGSNIRFVVTPTTRTYSINGGAITAFTTTADVLLAGANSITINTAAGNDIINIGAFTANLPSLTVNGGMGNDAVNFNGDLTFATDASLDVDLQNDDATPGDDAVNIAADANLVLSGTGTATVKVSQNVTVNAGGSIETANGDLLVEANQQATPTAGDFSGVTITGASSRLACTGSGTLTVKGKGGTYVNGFQFGIYVFFGGKINGGSGQVTVYGTGGAASGDHNYGVYVVGDNTLITSSGGDVSVTGLGGGTGASIFNTGVKVYAIGQITAGGSGKVTVLGQGGTASTGRGNIGVEVFVNNALITSSGGDVSVTGLGGGTGASRINHGVSVTYSQITAGGSGKVTVQGTGGAASGNNNFGVYVFGEDARITSSGGDVSVTGLGGGTGASESNYGVLVNYIGQITADGSGKVTVQGTGGAATGINNYGVFVFDTDARITSSGGDVSVTGIEGGGPSGTGFITQSGAVTTVPNGGNITLIANSMSIDADGMSTPSGNSVTLRPYTNGVPIDLGSATNPIGGPLGLSDTELDLVTTGTLIIGHTLAGTITVSADITRSASTNVQLLSGGDVTISGGGINTGGGTLFLDPGTSPAAVKPIFTNTVTADVTASTLSFGSDLEIAINGTTPGDGTGSTYSQLTVAGMVNLTGVDLILSGSHTPVIGNTFTIVDNDGVDAVIGTFAGLAQGATITNFLGSGLNAQITYTGGTGNDVVLIVSTPTLGTYSDATVIAGQNTTVTPNVAPTNAPYIVAYTNTNFTGILTVDPATGVVRVTDAKQAGTYIVTVDAFGVSETFTLTVTNPSCSAGLLDGTTNIGTGLNPYAVAIGDFNGDGNQDIASANATSNTVSIRLGDGAGGFSGSTEVAVSPGPYYVSVGDFNGDGKQDIATANFDSDNVSIRLGDGTGNFSGSTEVTVGDAPRSVSIGDFNNDGIQDFAAPNFFSGTVSIRLGNGAGDFSGSTEVSAGGFPALVAIGDFNEDGNRDFAVANQSSTFVSIRLGDGTGNFSTSANVTVGSSARSIALGDFNGDGHQDFAATSFNTSSVYVSLGDGAGNFGTASSVGAGASPVSVAIGDFNGDGKQDFATANESIAKVSVRLGNGAGGFSGSGDVPVGFYPAVVAVGDFDGDNKQDIAVANLLSNTVSIRLGSNSQPDANVQGNSMNIADGDATPGPGNDDTDFGNVTVGNNLVRTFTLQNTGTADLSVSSIMSNNALFTIGALTPASPIPMGMSATFTVTFSPVAVGVQNATITINNNDCDEGVYDFAITGMGVSGCPTITFTATPTNISCTGGSNGQIAVANVVGGTPPFMYSINNGANYSNNAAFTGLTPGPYSVRVQDANLCESAVTPITLIASDVVAPQIACPANQIVCTNPVSNNYVIQVSNVPNPVVTDNCSTLADATYQFTGATTGTGTGSASGRTLNLNTTTIRYTVTDAGGTSSCAFTVTVRKSPWPYWQPGSLTVGLTNFDLKPYIKDYRAATKQYDIYEGNPSNGGVLKCTMSATNGIVNSGQSCMIMGASNGLHQYYAVAISSLPAPSCPFTSVAFPVTVNAVEPTHEGDITLSGQEAGAPAPLLYPNPTGGLLHLQLLEREISDLQMLFYDTDGRLVLESNGTNLAPTLQQFDLSRLPAGVYSFRLLVGGQAYSGRVVKMNE